MISKKRSALKALQQHLVDKTIQKHYLCIAKGQPALNEQRIDAPLLRYTLASGERRVKVDAQDAQAKESQTDIIVHGRFMLANHPVSLIEAKPLTGRTHQIRVHLQYLKAPMLGDPVYGIGNILPLKLMTQTLRDAVAGFKRQALHATKLGLIHPVTQQPMEWQIELADDMKALLEAMRHEDVPEEVEPFDFGVDENGLYIGDDDEDWDDEDFDDDDLLEDEA